MQFKFISLNLWKGGKLFENIVAFLKKEDPDIIAFQEVCNSNNQKLGPQFRSFKVLKEKLRFPYTSYSLALLEKRPEGKIPWGNAVFSTFPIIDNQTFPFGQPFCEVELEKMTDFSSIPRVLQQVTIKASKVKLSVFNNHGIWGFDGWDNPQRLKMSKIIVEKIKNKKNVLLAGDFNVRPKTKTINNIEEHLRNVFKDELQTSFNLKRKPKEGGWAESVVDMIFVSPDIKVIDHYCPQVDISDHLPLVCSLGI